MVGEVSTFAGWKGPDCIEPYSEICLNGPRAVTVDGSGNVFVADMYTMGLPKINPKGEASVFETNG
jgi:hypothetical protein